MPRTHNYQPALNSSTYNYSDLLRDIALEDKRRREKLQTEKLAGNTLISMGLTYSAALINPLLALVTGAISLGAAGAKAQIETKPKVMTFPDLEYLKSLASKIDPKEGKLLLDINTQWHAAIGESAHHLTFIKSSVTTEFKKELKNALSATVKEQAANAPDVIREALGRDNTRNLWQGLCLLAVIALFQWAIFLELALTYGTSLSLIIFGMITTTLGLGYLWYNDQLNITKSLHQLPHVTYKLLSNFGNGIAIGITKTFNNLIVYPLQSLRDFFWHHEPVTPQRPRPFANPQTFADFVADFQTSISSASAAWLNSLPNGKKMAGQLLQHFKLRRDQILMRWSMAELSGDKLEITKLSKEWSRLQSEWQEIGAPIAEQNPDSLGLSLDALLKCDYHNERVQFIKRAEERFVEAEQRSSRWQTSPRDENVRVMQFSKALAKTYAESVVDPSMQSMKDLVLLQAAVHKTLPAPQLR